MIPNVRVSDPEVRFSVLENLDEIFDSYLSQPENLTALFFALNDEVFEIREIALCTVGRLSLINPAYVLPGLRKVLVQVSTEIFARNGFRRLHTQSHKHILYSRFYMSWSTQAWEETRNRLPEC
jgi:FKBP12-rapamycin complex-associated protein